MKKIIILAIAFVSICATQNVMANENTKLYANTRTTCRADKPVEKVAYIYHAGTGEWKESACKVYVRKEDGKLIGYCAGRNYDVKASDRCEYRYMIDRGSKFDKLYFN